MNERQNSSRLYLRPDLQIIFAVTLMAVLGVSSIAPVLPNMIDVFGISIKEAGWLVAVFTLPGIVLMPFLGFLADRLGRRVILIPSLALFCLAGTACAFASDFKVLLILRFFQGLGACSLGTLNVTLIGDLFAGRERIEAMGYNAGVLSLGTAVYPALGGALGLVSWRGPFFLPLLSLPVILLVTFRLKENESKQEETIPAYLGNLLNAVRDSRVLILFTGIFAAFMVIYGVCITIFPLFMRETFSASPFMIGGFLSIMSLGTILASVGLRRWADWLGERVLVFAGFVLYAIVCLVFPFIRHTGWLMIPAWILGIANGLTVPTIYALLTEWAPEECRASVMAMNGMFIRLGQTAGPCLLSFVYYYGGIPAGFLSGTVLSVLMGALLAGGIGFARDRVTSGPRPE